MLIILLFNGSQQNIIKHHEEVASRTLALDRDKHQNATSADDCELADS